MPVDFNIKKNLFQKNFQSTRYPLQQQPTQNIIIQKPQKLTQNIVNTYLDTSTTRKNIKLLFFSDSIPKGINMRNFSSLLRANKSYMNVFPGSKSI